jgi:hypothetical protein
MLLNDRTRKWLAVRRARQSFKERGFEEIGESGGRMWELHRGGRQDCRITACEIDPLKKTVWVRVEKS